MNKKAKELVIVNQSRLRGKIYTIRGEQVMLDTDLAELYGVETKVLNQAVKRNIERFPKEFMFKLTLKESDFLRSQIVTLKKGRGQHRKYVPYVFTEQGVSMLASILKSKTAIKVSIQIIKAFVSMKKFIASHANMLERLSAVEERQIMYEIKTDKKIDKALSALESKELKEKQGIFYDGQVFEAYIFVAGLVRKAKKSITIIDNYVDETVLNMLTKRKKGVKVKILTKNISKQLSLDIAKYNAQYPTIQVVKYGKTHDRFMILDDKDIYHIGASLKDLGNKLFAFSKINSGSVDLIKNIKNIK